MTESTDGGAHWVRHPSALWRSSLERALVLPPDAEEPILLSATAALLWDALARPAQADTVADTLTTRRRGAVTAA